MNRRSVAVAILAVAFAGLGVANASTGSKAQWVRVASGSFAGRSWAASMKGGNGKSCSKLTLNGTSSSDGLAVCGDAQKPLSPWGSGLGVSDESGSASVEFNITNKRTHSLRALLEYPNSNQEPAWVHAETTRLTRSQARRARLKRNFRLVVLHSVPSFCVRKVVLFDRLHRRIETDPLPCEFKHRS